MVDKVRNYIAGEWRTSEASELQDVYNPATGAIIARTPLSLAKEVDQAAQAAAASFAHWRRLPATGRIQYLFKLPLYWY